MRRPRRFFLAVHGVERDDAVGHLQFAEQLLGCGDLIGLCLDVDMGQDQAGFDVEACSTWAALRSLKLSKLRLSVLPSSAMDRREGSAAASCRAAA